MARNATDDADREPTDTTRACVPVTLNADGKRVTIPHSVRALLDLDAGDQFWLMVEEVDR